MSQVQKTQEPTLKSYLYYKTIRGKAVKKAYSRSEEPYVLGWNLEPDKCPKKKDK
jgi:hypothetical protein